MAKQKAVKSRWFKLMVGGISFLVLASSVAQAKQFVNEYQAKPSSFVVALNSLNEQVLMKKALAATEQERTQLIQRNKAAMKIHSATGQNKLRVKVNAVNGNAVIALQLLSPSGAIIDQTVVSKKLANSQNTGTNLVLHKTVPCLPKSCLVVN